MVNKSKVIERTRRWVADFVIGLSICPFAKHAFDRDLIDYVVYEGTVQAECIELLSAELQRLESTPASDSETSLIILSELSSDFLDYLDLVDMAEETLVNLKLEGIFQIASFHPEYQFGGTEVSDISNHTNRSPYPMLHILREDSVHEATQRHPDVESIPDRNIQLLQSMNPEEVRRYLK